MGSVGAGKAPVAPVDLEPVPMEADPEQAVAKTTRKGKRARRGRGDNPGGISSPQTPFPEYGFRVRTEALSTQTTKIRWSFWANTLIVHARIVERLAVLQCLWVRIRNMSASELSKP